MIFKINCSKIFVSFYLFIFYSIKLACEYSFWYVINWNTIDKKMFSVKRYEFELSRYSRLCFTLCRDKIFIYYVWKCKCKCVERTAEPPIAKGLNELLYYRWNDRNCGEKSSIENVNQSRRVFFSFFRNSGHWLRHSRLLTSSASFSLPIFFEIR